MLSLLKTVVIVVLAGALVFMVIKLPEWAKEEPAPKEAPCEELRWMRDLPQRRCVEFWENYKVEEV
jgi:hypothetical protein